jgi:hypothetical protein
MLHSRCKAWAVYAGTLASYFHAPGGQNGLLSIDTRTEVWAALLLKLRFDFIQNADD